MWYAGRFLHEERTSDSPLIVLDVNERMLHIGQFPGFRRPAYARYTWEGWVAVAVLSRVRTHTIHEVPLPFLTYSYEGVF